uniref:Putative secreted peptide n=1 Tax=Anopheles braziliensis TaxID=58242 RepID=A0A2M3ZX81_9DIPT
MLFFFIVLCWCACALGVRFTNSHTSQIHKHADHQTDKARKGESKRVVHLGASLRRAQCASTLHTHTWSPRIPDQHQQKREKLGLAST